MRSFVDTQLKLWQAAVLDASYGNTLVVFSRPGSEVIRKTMLDAENLRVAEEQLLGMQESELRELLTQSVPWD